jgi:hypothetical protein
MKPQILALIALTLLCGACANSQRMAKSQHERKALGVRETHWGNLPAYTPSAPLGSVRVLSDVAALYTPSDRGVNGSCVLDLLVKANGTVADVHLVEKSGDEIVAQTVTRTYSKLKFAPNNDPGVTEYVTRLTVNVRPVQQIGGMRHDNSSSTRYAPPPPVSSNGSYSYSSKSP